MRWLVVGLFLLSACGRSVPREQPAAKKDAGSADVGPSDGSVADVGPITDAGPQMMFEIDFRVRTMAGNQPAAGVMVEVSKDGTALNMRRANAGGRAVIGITSTLGTHEIRFSGELPNDPGCSYSGTDQFELVMMEQRVNTFTAIVCP